MVGIVCWSPDRLKRQAEEREEQAEEREEQGEDSDEGRDSCVA